MLNESRCVLRWALALCFAASLGARAVQATYYYAVGVEAPLLTSHFGLRAQFRQSFYLLPDFTANFLTIKQRTNSVEPSVGFYLHY